ncbi:hypothetical protein SCALIN_C04_0314 [Candidatus Scalindua japonica]|uniref:Uncharacterized protein n=1 Tax=Candidatus Scalindua japonica TaxID=1284222 RepID=A0A286TVC6_9BACT|nr:hypothetical protein [Candidatus Scalindua japonica]GAX59826.1 hypothetical protein SCALIN_C04_0314 [Candidatus Scalindua japonica]
MFDLTEFSLHDMSEVGDALQQLELKAKNIDELTDMVVQYFFDNLVDTRTGEKSSVLVRFFMTYPYSSLDVKLRQSVDKMLNGQPVDQDMKCLKLSATAGVKPEWNSTIYSKGHRVLPLQNKDMLKKNIMVHQFIDQMGMGISNVLNPDPKLSSELEGRVFNVYHVSEALGSPYIPAQKEFVVPFGVKSAMGIGGMLPTGNLFALLIFSKTKIPHNTANLFKNIALNVRMAVLPFVNEKIFVIDKEEISEEERLRSLIATQTSLLEVYKTTAKKTRRTESVSFNIANIIGKFTKKIWLYVCLISVSAFFLFIHWLTHNEFMLHLAAIPIEIMFGALLIEKILEKKRKTEQSKRLMHFRCYLFRSRLRNIFIANLNTLKFPIISISKIKSASLEDLKQMRKEINHIEYISLDAMETIITEYVPAYHAFYSFMEWTIIHDIDSGFENMIYILHFIEEVKLFKHNNPDTPYVYEAQRNRSLMKKVKKVLAEGMFNFLDFLIELKRKDPALFCELLSDYEELPQDNHIVHERRNS